MNKKLLLTLFIVPIGFLAADKVLGLNTQGGEKEKMRKISSVATSQQGEAPDFGYGQVAVKDLDRMPKEERAKYADLIGRLKSEEGIEAMESEYHQGNFVYDTDDAGDDALFALLDEGVEEVLEEMNVFDIDLQRQFSRCSSGYRYVVIESDAVVSRGEGYMVRDEGCWDRPIAKFQYDVAAKDVYVRFTDELGALSIRDFLKLYQEVG